jgi:hypothetical protein
MKIRNKRFATQFVCLSLRNTALFFICSGSNNQTDQKDEREELEKALQTKILDREGVKGYSLF